MFAKAVFENKVVNLGDKWLNWVRMFCILKSIHINKTSPREWLLSKISLISLVDVEDAKMVYSSMILETKDHLIQA